MASNLTHAKVSLHKTASPSSCPVELRGQVAQSSGTWNLDALREAEEGCLSTPGKTTRGHDIEAGESGQCHLHRNFPAGLGALPVPGGWISQGRQSAGTAAALGGRCFAAELGMTEQPVCPCCQSGCTWWGRGVQHVLSGCSPPGVHLLGSPAPRQITLTEGSGGA